MGKPTIYINFGIINNFNCIKLKVKVVISWTVYEICSLFFNDIIQNEKFHKIYLITISKQRASAMKPYLALFHAPFFFWIIFCYSKLIQNGYHTNAVSYAFGKKSWKRFVQVFQRQKMSALWYNQITTDRIILGFSFKFQKQKNFVKNF